MTSFIGTADPMVTKRITATKGYEIPHHGPIGKAAPPGRKKTGSFVRFFLHIFAAVGLMIMLMSIREGQHIDRVQPLEVTPSRVVKETKQTLAEGQHIAPSPQYIAPSPPADLGNPVAEEDKNITEGHPVFGKRKLLHDHNELVDYVKALSTNPAATAGRRVARYSGKSNVEIRYVELTQSEEKVLANNEVSLWKDLSGVLYKEIAKSCISCSVEEPTRNKYGEIDRCDVKRDDKPWCNTWCPLKKHCLGWSQRLHEEMNETGGFSRFQRRPQQFNPYLVIFTGGVYVTENGEVYNDEVMFDSRGRCSRKSTGKIRRRRADKFTYKKVYVVDHVWRGPYHEMADAAARLFFYHKELLADPEIKLHATTDWHRTEENMDINPWQHHQVSESQIAIFEAFGINGSRFVTGDIYAEEVIVSQVHCTSNENLYEISEGRLRDAIHKHLWSLGAPRDLPIGKGYILLLKRSVRRRITNHDDLLAGLRRIAGDKKVVVYDDSALLRQSQIWSLFYHADLVVAPHGAGLVNILVCREGASILEFIQPSYTNTDPANCNFNYRSLSIMMGLNYYADLPAQFNRPSSYVDRNGQKVDPPTSMTVDLRKALQHVQEIIQEHVVSRAHRVPAKDG